MRKTVLYIAMSLDGYIADENGGVGWLDGYSGIEGSWKALMQRTDTVFMGRRTYDQITNEALSLPMGLCGPADVRLYPSAPAFL